MNQDTEATLATPPTCPRFGIHLPICLILLMLTACQNAGHRAEAHDSTITVLYIGDERILGPYWEMPAKFLMFLPLVTYDQSGQLQPRLAERWEHSPDYRTWTFHLRQDVNWHDGVPVTAHDIKFTLELFSHPDVLRFPPKFLSIDILDEFTLRLTYTKPTDALNTWTVYYPKHLLRDLDPKEFYQWKFWKRPVGNGPYRYIRHVPQTMIELELGNNHSLSLFGNDSGSMELADFRGFVAAWIATQFCIYQKNPSHFCVVNRFCSSSCCSRRVRNHTVFS